MKISLQTLFILICFFTLISCEKDDAPDHLPLATQTGAGIFACLVNGEIFTHEDGLINCYYQYVDGGYYFSISGDKEDSNGLFSISLATIRKEIQEGETYQLLEETEGNALGGGGFGLDEYIFVSTNENDSGELTITKLDFENHIVSGTFWFNLKHPVTGDTIKIRQGRFDSHFGT